MPLEVFAEAACLPGKALAVVQLVHLQARLSGQITVRLSRDLLADCGIGTRAEQKALKTLEAAGLIRVYRKSEDGTVITISGLAADLQELRDTRRETSGRAGLPEALVNDLIVSPGGRSNR
jgi:hypothetical protein